MTAPLAFLSFDIDHDEGERARFCGGLADSTTLFSVDDWSVNAGATDSDREKAFRGRIGRCDLMIILIGRDTGSSVTVAKEIEFAKRANVPFFGVFIDGADEATALPIGLVANRVIPMDWGRVGSAVGQLMAEGKNHKFV